MDVHDEVEYMAKGKTIFNFHTENRHQNIKTFHFLQSLIMCWRDIVKNWFLAKTLQCKSMEILNLIYMTIGRNQHDTCNACR